MVAADALAARSGRTWPRSAMPSPATRPQRTDRPERERRPWPTSCGLRSRLPDEIERPARTSSGPVRTTCSSRARAASDPATALPAQDLPRRRDRQRQPAQRRDRGRALQPRGVRHRPATCALLADWTRMGRQLGRICIALRDVIVAAPVSAARPRHRRTSRRPSPRTSSSSASSPSSASSSCSCCCCAASSRRSTWSPPCS